MLEAEGKVKDTKKSETKGRLSKDRPSWGQEQGHNVQVF